MDFDQLPDLLSRLRHPGVRDLAWALLSPPLLSEPPAPQRHPFTASRWAASPGLLADWLQRQDSDPQALQAWLSQASNRRLGLYYERLWQFALSRAPDIELLGANLPVRQGGHTLGELDLLLRDAEGVHHLELAVKFYLGLDGVETGRHAHWIGPGAEDRLDLKLEHLGRHQLTLPSRPETRMLLDRLVTETVHSALWLGGYLFAPWWTDCAPPAGAHPAHLRGRWLHHQQWPVRHAGRWQPLPRRAWLAPARLPADEVWTNDDFRQWLARLPAEVPPQMLVRLSPATDGAWLECERCFLVADAWPGRPV